MNSIYKGKHKKETINEFTKYNYTTPCWSVICIDVGLCLNQYEASSVVAKASRDVLMMIKDVSVSNVLQWIFQHNLSTNSLDSMIVFEEKEGCLIDFQVWDER